MNPFSDVPRQTLERLLARDGEALLEDPARCEGLLKDYCGACRREISALVAALEERVAVDLRSSWQTSMTPEAMRARMVQRLSENRGLAKDVAEYAVDTWSQVMGVRLERSSERLPTQVIAVPQQMAMPQPLAPPPPPPPPVAYPVMAAAPLMAAPPPAPPSRSSVSSVVVGSLGALALLVIGLFAVPRIMDQYGESRKKVPCTDSNKPAGCAPTPTPAPGPEPVAKPTYTLGAGTVFAVMLDSGLSSKTAAKGQGVDGTLTAAVKSGETEILPAGAKVRLQVKAVDTAGKLAGVPQLNLAVAEFERGGLHYPVVTGEYIAKGPSRTENTAKKRTVGAAIGCAGGAVVGVFTGKAKKDCGKGANAGAAGGTVVAATDEIQPAVIPAGTVMRLSLLQPVTVE